MSSSSDASIYKDIFPVQERSATLTKGGATAKIANHSPPVQHSSLIHVPMLMNSVKLKLHNKPLHFNRVSTLVNIHI